MAKTFLTDTINKIRFYVDIEGNFYLPCIVEQDETLCRSVNNGYYYKFKNNRTDFMEMISLSAEETRKHVVAFLEDKEQGRLGYLTRDFK